ncbi:type I restriction endonuclease subunit R [candidate division KSB1 bacterium]|nr:type I restriction endonuclease subunit R [candidate division KSB1 bacterium]
MHTPSFKEDHISQIPALQFAINLGYTYLSQSEVMQLRGDKTSIVLLEPIIKQQLEKMNRIEFKGQAVDFAESNIRAAIQALKDVPMHEGYMAGSEYVYDLLTLGTTVEQSMQGDKKSFTLHYIDWENWQNNVFHVTEEFSVLRSKSHEHYRPDIVLFVNGIPLVIIECKRPDMKEPIEQAISQHLRNQNEDGIRALYVYSQLVMGLAVNDGRYATVGTKPEFWCLWREDLGESDLIDIKNRPISAENRNRLFADRFRYVRHYFAQLEQEHRQVTEQDKYLYSLCRPERLLDLMQNFILFDDGIKKIARYQQYFAVKETLNRVHQFEGGRRKGGVIWHTQGSGKSLTMVMMAQAIALDKTIRNPKIVMVTDRVDLDEQISGTFEKCDKRPLQAKTGSHLLELLSSKSDAVITTVINKFEAAVNRAKKPFESSNIFILVDEGHRSQYGSFNVNMQRVFPNGCFLAFTGTPLMKKEKNTALRFGGIIHPTYTIRTAVEDKAVVPLLYEGRHALQEVQSNPIDIYFSRIAEPLNDAQKADLKRKYSQANQLNIADQKVYCIAWDISDHFAKTWQGSEFKGQLVCQNKVAAIKYKQYLDEIGKVSSEVLISPPDQREGSDSAYAKPNERVLKFWHTMMQEHGTPKRYEKNIISRFKNTDEPEIIIVVDKLLTGFDAPCDTVLYLTRSLKEHTLLQAIARVNRLFPGKDFGYVIDYYGVLGELDEALNTYSGLEYFEQEDLDGTIAHIENEIKKLPQAHSELWDIFKEIKNIYDESAYEELLRDEERRSYFYEKLSEYARLLKMALSTMSFVEETPNNIVRKYKEDLKFFIGLRLAVKQRFSDIVDFKAYEKQIQHLIDKHIESSQVVTVAELVNIFDREKFQEQVAQVVGEAAKADMIASRTTKYINEKMDQDPAFYKKFSELLKEAIRAYEEKRISEAEFLKRATEISESVLNHTDSGIPKEFDGRAVASAFYGLSFGHFEKMMDNNIAQKIATIAGLGVDDIIQQHVLDNGKSIVDWPYKSDVVGRLQIEIGDFLIDDIKDKYGIELSYNEIEELVEQFLDVAKKRYV